MYDTIDRPTRTARGPVHALLLALMLWLATGAVAAQDSEPVPEAPAPPAAASASPVEAPPSEASPAAISPAGGLRGRIESGFEVLPVRGGLLLQPRQEFRGVRTIEITGSDLAVNGRAVDEGELRDWMGERADDVLRLADLAPDERLSLFEVEEPGAATEAVEAGADGAAGARVSVEGEDGGAAVVVAPEVPVERDSRRRVHRGNQTVVGSTVRIASDEVSDDVVVLGGSADIEGRVEGDVTVFGGRIDVDGEVTHDVTAIGGNVHLGEDSEVGGEVTAVGGHVRREAGARVRGGINEVQRGFDRGWHGPRWRGWSWDGDGPGWSPAGWMLSMTWPIAQLIFLAFVVLFIVAIARPTVERVGARAGREPLKAGIVGLLVAVLIFPAFLIVAILLAVSIIGIPILIVVVLLFVFIGIPGLVIGALVGYSSVAWRLGRWTEGRFGWRLESVFMAALAGLLFLHVLELVGQALDFGPLRFFAVMFGLAGLLVQTAAWAVGFGAVVLELYDRRQRRRAALAAAYAVPMATAPPAGTVPPPPPPTPEPPPEPIEPEPPFEPEPDDPRREE